MKFTFGITHTKHGCTVHMDGPSGHRYKARFRNTYQCSALVSAENWVWGKRQEILQESEIAGKKVTFEVPPELDRANDRKMVSLPVDLWATVEERSRADGVGYSEWIRQAVVAKMH